MIILLSCLIGFWLAIRYILSKVVRHFIFQPTYNVVKYSDEEYDDVYLNNGINLWLFKRQSNNKILLYCHGSGGNLSSRKHIIEITKKLDIDLCLFDYRGYGKSIPNYYITSQSIIDDGNYIFDYLMRSYDKENIIICGTSMGSFVATCIAKYNNCKKLILVDTLSSVDDVALYMAKNNTIISSLIKLLLKVIQYSDIDLLRTKTFIKNLDCDILMIHGELDDLTGIKYARNIHAICPRSKLIVIPDGNHYNIFHYRDIVHTAFAQFINT